MSGLADIRQAILQLSAADRVELERWWDEHREAEWDEQLAADARPDGRLAGLLARVDADIDAGRTTPWPR